MKKFLVIFFFLSLLFSMPGVFGLESGSYIALENSTLQCGIFTRGNSEKPNWIPDSWSILQKNPELYRKSLTLESCKNDEIQSCCSDLGYSYTPNFIGISELSSGRQAAEFLSQKGIIASQSYNPTAYKLSDNISRREMLKLIISMSDITPDVYCNMYFRDIALYDWGCKYVEAGLRAGFISENEYFRPDDPVNAIEALKLIFQVQGIQKRYETHSWQQDYSSSAYYLGLTDEKIFDFTSPVSRGWIFEVIQRSYKLK